VTLLGEKISTLLVIHSLPMSLVVLLILIIVFFIFIFVVLVVGRVCGGSIR
jgi:hypothetical protein